MFENHRAIRFFWLGLFIGSAAASAADQGRRKEEPALNSQEEGIRRNIVRSYQYVTKTVIKKTMEESGFETEMRLIPNAALYQTVIGFKDVEGSGYQGKHFEKKLQEVYTKHQGERDKMQFRISIKVPKDKIYLLKDDLLRHIVVQPKTIKYSIIDVKPRPVFESYKVFRNGQVGRASLARIEKTFEFTLVVPKKSVKGPIEITLRGIVGQQLLGNHHNGINPWVKQISCKDWNDLIVPPITFKYERDLFDLPLPGSYREILKELSVPDPGAIGPEWDAAGKPELEDTSGSFPKAAKDNKKK